VVLSFKAAKLFSSEDSEDSKSHIHKILPQNKSWTWAMGL